MNANAHRLRRKLPALAAGLFLLLFTAGVVWLVKDFINSAGKPQKPRVQQISLVKPPPPKPEEKPPEPKKVEQPKEEVKIDQPTPPPDSPPAPNAGGIPDGPPGGMATDLAAGSGTGIIGGGGREDWYGRLISRHFEDVLRRSKRLQGTTYNVTVHVWFDGGGSIDRVQLARGSGNSQTDEALREELLALPPLRETFPADLRQPVRIRVASRG